MEANNQALDPTVKRSETERHWDIVCLTVVTLATAVFGSVVVLSGVAEARQADVPITDLDIMTSIFPLLAAGLYFFIVLEAVRTVFPPPQHRGEKGLAWKRTQAISTFAMFLALIFLAGATVFFLTVTSVYFPWLRQEMPP